MKFDHGPNLLKYDFSQWHLRDIWPRFFGTILLTFFEIIAKSCFKVDTTSLKLEIRLHAHSIGTNTRSGTESIFAFISLVHAFGTMLLDVVISVLWRVSFICEYLRYFAHSLISGLKFSGRDESWTGDCATCGRCIELHVTLWADVVLRALPVCSSVTIGEYPVRNRIVN